MSNLLKSKKSKLIVSIVIVLMLSISILAVPVQATFYNSATVTHSWYQDYDYQFWASVPVGNPYNFTYTTIYFNSGWAPSYQEKSMLDGVSPVTPGADAVSLEIQHYDCW